jgi:glutaredoxin 3
MVKRPMWFFIKNIKKMTDAVYLIELYITDMCPYCVSAKQLLDRLNLCYVVYDVTHDVVRRQEMLERAQGRRTVPQIFINQKPIGGCDDLHALYHAKTLYTMLNLPLC